jgi:aspartate carbamoyltransferase catalytic subunit
MRHPKEGAPYVASRNATVPVINAGDGGHSHPTQTLTDLFTIRREKGRLHDLTVGFGGDLKYGRTVHSLISALSRYTGIKLVLISPEELKIPSYIKREIIEKSTMECVETTDLEAALPELDILYMTRIQGERFAIQDDYLRLKDSYILTVEKMALAKRDMAILHPLPRVNEISVKIDADPRACYFRQVANGKYMRMALILKLLEEAAENRAPVEENDGFERIVNRLVCQNRRCITTVEQELDQVFRLIVPEAGICRCLYCEAKQKIE